MSQPEPPVTETPAKRWPWIAGASVLLLAIAAVVFLAVRPSKDAAFDRFDKTDHFGAQACDGLRIWLDGKQLDDHGDVESSIIMALALSDPASRATSADIRAAVGGPAIDDQSMSLLQQNGYNGGQMVFTNLRRLDDACLAHGLSMPPYSETPTKAK